MGRRREKITTWRYNHCNLGSRGRQATMDSSTGFHVAQGGVFKDKMRSLSGRGVCKPTSCSNSWTGAAYSGNISRFYITHKN